MKIHTAALVLASLPVYLDTTVQAGLLPRLKQKGHLAFTRRGGGGDNNPQWTSKQDSELLDLAEHQSPSHLMAYFY